MSDRSVVIVGAKRTPIGSFQGQFSPLAATDLGAAAIASQSHRYYGDSYESRHERRCRRWMYSCDNGSYHACRQFDRRC